MNTVPIVFAFDDNLVFPACVCLSSLMMSARKDTFYDIFILYPGNSPFDRSGLDRIPQYYGNCRLSYRPVDGSLDKAFEIRGITVPAYYRLLIPELVPEYGKILYSDPDVIFRHDLSDVYYGTDMSGSYVAGVNSLAFMNPDYRKYYERLGEDPSAVIYSGNLIINSRKILEDNLMPVFRSMAEKKFRFQDMDILNIACKGGITYLPPKFCLTSYVSQYAVEARAELLSLWTDAEIEEALSEGIVHYNGQKPWKGSCVNFDIWWEYYRKSPFFDRKFYFDFFYGRLEELDRLSLWKRIKVLGRYFVFGRRK